MLLSIVFDYQDFDARNKFDNSVLKQFKTSGNYPFQTLIRNLDLSFFKKVSFKIKEFEYYSVFLELSQCQYHGTI